MPIESTQTIPLLRTSFGRGIKPQQELQATGSGGHRGLALSTSSRFGFGRQVTAWRVFEHMVCNTFARRQANGSNDRKQSDIERLQLRQDNDTAMLLAQRITADFRALQHGWDKPLTVRHIEIVAELAEAAQQQQADISLAARAEKLWEKRPRGGVIEGVCRLDIGGLHRKCIEQQARPKQELRGNPTQHGGNVLKLKPEGERGTGFGRKVHQQDAWAKFQQVLVNTFAPKTNPRWESPHLSVARLAAGRAMFEAAYAKADELASAIVKSLQANDPATPLLVEHVAQAHRFVMTHPAELTREGWSSFIAAHRCVEPEWPTARGISVVPPTLSEPRTDVPDSERVHASSASVPAASSKQATQPAADLTEADFFTRAAETS